MRLREKLEREQGLDKDKILLLDTSAILSDENALDYPNHKIVTTGVLGELYKLSFQNELAKEKYQIVSKMIEEGTLYLMHSDVHQETPDTVLSPIDSNLIRMATYFQKSMIISCDHALCAIARSRGIPAYGVRTIAS